MSKPGNVSAAKKKDKITIYFLASSRARDIEACKTVHKHLKQFIRNSKPPIEIYSDYSIPAGEDINKYREMLYHSDVVLAFGTGDFIGDDETVERVEKVILRYNKRETVLLAILVRHFQWDEPFFKYLPIFPKSKRPIYDKKWGKDDAFTRVAKELKEELMKYYSVEQSTIAVRTADDETSQPPANL